MPALSQLSYKPHTLPSRSFDPGTTVARDASGRLSPSGSVAPADERQPLVERIGDAIRQSVAEAAESALVLIDINDFAGFNAAWGVAAGNEALVAVAARIEDFAVRLDTPATSRTSVAGRLDGDHFIILVSRVASHARLRSVTAELIRFLSAPFRWGATPSR